MVFDGNPPQGTQKDDQLFLRVTSGSGVIITVRGDLPVFWNPQQSNLDNVFPRFQEQRQHQEHNKKPCIVDKTTTK